MPRYEFVEGASKKFWEIALEGSSFTTTYGRIGTDGQMSMKEYDSEEKAQKEYDKLIAEKTKKGYALVDGTAAAAAPAKPAPAAAKPAPAPAKPAPAAAKKASAVFDDEGDDDDDDDEAPKPKKAAAAKPAPVAKAAPTKAAPSAGASKSGDEGARYFEFVDGSSSKFWEIKREGTSFTTRYGKIGTDGQMSMKEYDSEDKTEREYDKLVAEKTKKGYVEK
jgi:predicted DNA-binding WGR domain protein